MPLPIGQIAVFAAIALPYVVVLTILGLPFSHTYFWLYVLPPGLLAWLATRPVLESKRLPELVVSQVRYIGEPKTWCRLAPLAEKDEVVVYARVWRRAEEAAETPAPALAPARELKPAPIRAAPSRRVGRSVPQPRVAPSAQAAVTAPSWPAAPARRPGAAGSPAIASQARGPAGLPERKLHGAPARPGPCPSPKPSPGGVHLPRPAGPCPAGPCPAGPCPGRPCPGRPCPGGP